MAGLLRTWSRHALIACIAVLASWPVPAQQVPSAGLGEILCSATATVPVVRIEGTSELVGDVLITCHNAAPDDRPAPTGFVEADITLSLNVGVGNRTGFGLGPDVSDAVVVVNEKNCAATSAVRSFTGCGNQTVQDPMLARLDSTGPRTLRWSGVAIPVPGAAIPENGSAAGDVADCTGRFGVPGGCHPTTTTIRLTNLRVNASQLGPSGRAEGVAIPVQASLSVRAPGTSVRLEDGLLRVGEAAAGLAVTAEPVDSDRLCSHGETVAVVALAEGFASSFKAPGEASFRPGQPGWEEAFYPTGGDDAASSRLTDGTRVRISLSGIPSGVAVYAPSSVNCTSEGGASSLMELVDGAAPSGTGGTVSTGQPGDRPLRVTAESAVQAVYEVRRSDPLSRETCRLGFRMSRLAAAGDLFGGWTVGVSASLSPFGPSRPEGDRDDRVRFAEVRFVPERGFPMTGCGTTLFFPFVTNRSNFDTAIVIANTSADPLGTRHQSGQCILQYRGSGVEGQTEPSIQRSAEIEAGRQLAFTLSSGSPGQGLVPLADFQGYLVAECGFQHGHGFAFVTEQVNGVAILAQGYLAEVIDDPSGTAPAADSP